MLHRALALVVFVVLVVAGCGGSDEEPGAQATTEPAAPGAEVLVTQECGETVVLEKQDVEPGQTALQALDRVADIETDDGGRFVTAIEGVEQDEGKQLAWLFYVNGVMAEKGAAEIELKAGDVEWWDLHDWEQTCPVPPAAQ